MKNEVVSLGAVATFRSDQNCFKCREFHAASASIFYQAISYHEKSLVILCIGSNDSVLKVAVAFNDTTIY